MSTQDSKVQKIVVRIHVGEDRMGATDDPVFLGLQGPGGREFRLEFRHGRPLRRGADDQYVLASPDDPDTNVDRAPLNDPTQPGIEAANIRGVYIRKGLSPIPNVRGHGEMDDRVQIQSAEVEIHFPEAPKPRRFTLAGPVWLGLVCGSRVELVSDDEAS